MKLINLFTGEVDFNDEYRPTLLDGEGKPFTITRYTDVCKIMGTRSKPPRNIQRKLVVSRFRKRTRKYRRIK